MKNLEDIGRELERRGKADGIRKIAESEDGQRLSHMIDAKAIEAAAKSGDNEALRKTLSKVLSTSEGRRIAESVKKLMEN